MKIDFAKKAINSNKISKLKDIYFPQRKWWIIRRIVHVLLFFFIIIFLFLFTGRVLIFSNYQGVNLNAIGNFFWLQTFDPFILIFIFIDSILIFVLTSKNGLKNEKFWITILLCSLIFNSLWAISLNNYSSQNIYHFHIIYNYLIILAGLFFLRSIRNKIYQILEIIFKKSFIETVKESEFLENVQFNRATKFKENYPEIARVPLIGLICKWYYQNGKIYSTVVLILLVMAAVLRLYHLGTLSLWWDEGTAGLVSKAILQKGVPFMGEIFYWRGVAYYYLVSVFTASFGLTEFWLRFPSFLFGMGIVFLSFWYAKKINKWIGLLTLFFLVFSTYNIEYSRFARFYIMNAFLFLAAVYTIYLGFFQNKFKYKILSVVIFLLMLMTVQLGAIFMAIIGVWCIFFIYQLISKHRHIFATIKNNISNLIFLPIIVCIYYMDNPFQKFLQLDVTYAKNVLLGVDTPTYPLFQFPQWYLFDFFNKNYIPLIFFIFIGLLFIYLFFKKLKSQVKIGKQLSFLVYLYAVLFLSVIIYEIGSRNVVGPRIFLFAEGIYVIISSFAIYFIIKIFINNKKLQIFCTLVVLILLTVLIQPNFYDRITIQYGDDVSKDPFRNTSVAAYRADFKTQYTYLNEQIGPGDIWINVVSSYDFIMDRKPDYIFNQSGSSISKSIIDNNYNFINREGSKILTSVQDVQKIIDTKDTRKVWLVINGGSINVLYTVHVRNDFINFLNTNKEKIVYLSPDGLSKVFLFQ
ncbi:MAG: hypothetical protein WCV50_00080 [Patescibacteria group bacterium]|jgi:4-amino-4-deoxy-L-arabinose transferase-like glycosyltransferase